MNCPSCQNVDLKMSERAGVEIDYCPKCRGVWLDRGELDKIIERAGEGRTTGGPEREVYAPYGQPPAGHGVDRHHAAAPPPEPRRRREDDDDDNDDSKHGYRYQDPSHPPPQKKRKNWLGEMFDVF